MATSIVKLLRLASFVICAIVVLSFGAFAIEQTHSASNRQQEQIAGHPDTGASTHMGSVHRTLEEASNDLTSPFASVVRGSGSEWVTRGGRLLLALALYGFGLGYVARVLRVRV